MTELEFKALAAAGYNRIPLLLECFADLDTPLSLYLKLTEPGERAMSFLLESVVGGERFGRYSFIGLPARTFIRAVGLQGRQIEVVTNGKVVETQEADPLEFVREFLARFKPALRPGLPRFCGGLAGYFAYDVVRNIEKRLANTFKPDQLGTPDMLFALTEELAIIDNVSGKLYLLVYADPLAPDALGLARKRLSELRQRLSLPVKAPMGGTSRGDFSEQGGLEKQTTPIERDFAKADYLAAAHKAREYVISGDLMQVQIGQRLRKRFALPPLQLYRALRSINPSPYMYYYDFGDFHVVGASPEILVRQEAVGLGANASTKVTVRPIAGTRKRGLTPQQDEELAKDLLADPKECAEHLMLIDLARNDVGRIATIGSVKVTEQMSIEKYSHVMHIVSNVEGTLKPGLDNLDVLRATFPAGTLTGAPKVRAMEIIDELEPIKRGIYGGACGYLSFSGEMDLAIAIRTGIVKDGYLNVQAAAGIVYDSVAESEWQETESKARAMLKAAELAEQEFNEGGV
jgi:anthranilate synthase component I